MSALIISAIAIAFIHVILGPDHYLPFIALAKANKWSDAKTITITILCGLAHCLSSVVIGLIGIGLGIAVGKVTLFEGSRGDVASYLMIAFGLIYLIWSLKKLAGSGWKFGERVTPVGGPPMTHSPALSLSKGGRASAGVTDGRTRSSTNNLFWGIFIVFLFGPCEPLIPLLMYPAAKSNIMACIAVASVFTITTLATMLAAVMLALMGTGYFFNKKLSCPLLERYSHALASLVIIICGISIMMGL